MSATAISGLDEGSPVKLRGVRVGHVVGISIRYDRATGKSLAAVLCELSRGSISDERGANLIHAVVNAIIQSKRLAVGTPSVFYKLIGGSRRYCRPR